jgi:hypothetical protein
MEPEFDRAAAKAAGYTDAEIDSFLASRKTSAETRPLPSMSVPQDVTRAPRALSRVEAARQKEQRATAQERFRSQVESIPAAFANVLKDIPGGEAVGAATRALVRQQPYREALMDIREATGNLPSSVSIPTRVIGGALASAVMPGKTLARQAMQYGLASGATEASPDVGILGRAMRGAIQAAVGGAVTKGAQAVGTGIRAARGRTTSDVVIEEAGKRGAASTPLYDDFKTLGELPRTAKLDELLELPIVRRAIDLVKGESSKLNQLADTDARVLDAVYKRIGRKSFASSTGFEAGQTRVDLLDAIDEASGGLYGKAVNTFREGSQRMSAVQRGSRAFQRGQSATGGTTERALLEESPEALLQWAQTTTPEMRRLAAQGVLGAVRQSSGSTLLTPFSGLNPLPGVQRAFRGSGILEQLERMSPLRRALALGGQASVNAAGRSVFEQPLR